MSNEESDYSTSDEDSDGNSSESDQNLKPHIMSGSCLKLPLRQNLAAFIEKKELVRDTEKINCSQDVIDKVFNNYIIIKNIFKKLPWQDKVICKQVSSLWHSVMSTLWKEQLNPVDFSINLALRARRKGVVLKKSQEFYTEPMVIFTFFKSVVSFAYAVKCDSILPSPCNPACDKSHSVLDIIYQQTTAPKNCMYGVKAFSVSYLPILDSPTYDNIIPKSLQNADAFFCGVYIPTIPGVEFKIINAKSSNDIVNGLLTDINAISEKYTVKGAIACLTDNYLLFSDQENAECLEFLRRMQPNDPFAFGGCLIEDTANMPSDIEGIVDSLNSGKEFINCNLMTLGMFLVPKNEEPEENFEVYSLVIESTEWSRSTIGLVIQEFSQRIPRFEHSAALKLSCMGRHHKHDIEEASYRKFFPNTRIVGCFGNGELGVNMPQKKLPTLDSNKRPRIQSKDVVYEKLHSYSTVFLHICWGKLLASPERES